MDIKDTGSAPAGEGAGAGENGGQKGIMKKTKIICTMGPNSDDREVMKALILNGMDVARFNFSHGTHPEQKARMDMLKLIREEEHSNTAILLDTKGPEIRTGVLKDGKKVKLEAGAMITLTPEEVRGMRRGYPSHMTVWRRMWTGERRS